MIFTERFVQVFQRLTWASVGLKLTFSGCEELTYFQKLILEVLLLRVMCLFYVYGCFTFIYVYHTWL